MLKSKTIFICLAISLILNALGLYYSNTVAKEASETAYKITALTPYSDKILASEEIYDVVESFIYRFKNSEFDNLNDLWLNKDIEVIIKEDFILFRDDTRIDEYNYEQLLRKSAFNDYEFYLFNIEQSSAVLGFTGRSEYGSGHLYFHLVEDNGIWKIRELTFDI